MKKSIIIVLLYTIWVTQINAQKKQVSGYEASQATIHWLQNRHNELTDIEIIDIDSVRGNNGIVLFEVTTSVNQTVLLSGSKSCLPVLGTYKGSCLMNGDIPCGLAFMLEYYMQQIDTSFVQRDRKSLQYEKEWKDLLTGNVSTITRAPAVAPLTKSMWGQKSWNHIDDEYNYLIDGNNDCDHCIAGCVAVAMGQLVYYWKHPALSWNRVEQFDWCNMVDALNSSSENFVKNRYAISYLLRECGKYVDMEYGCESSGAQTCDISSALIDYFDFHEHTDCFHRYAHDNLLVNDWEDIILYNLSLGRPVIYAGNMADGEGHAFICDGYDGQGLYHFNWGWYGAYSGPNDWFTLSNPNPGGNSDFHDNQRAIMYARPNHDEDICDMDLDLGYFYSNNPFVHLHQQYNYPLPVPLYELVPQTMTTLTSASATSDASWRTIPTGATAVYQAHKEIILQDGFEAQLGCEFEARIEPCEQCDEMRGEHSFENDDIADSDSYGNDETPLYSTGGKPQPVDPDLFPNPTDGPLTMYTDGEPQKVLIYTLDGRPVGGWRLTTLGDDFVILDVSSLRPGSYILSIVTATATRTVRFIRH